MFVAVDMRKYCIMIGICISESLGSNRHLASFILNAVNVEIIDFF